MTWADRYDDADWYYDNDERPPVGSEHAPPTGEAAEQWLSVDRVYGLAWQRFTEADWDELGRIHQALPGRQPASSDVARWFSLDEGRELHLWASVEPTGLQVGGVLTVGLWWDWDTRFRRAVVDAGLPRSNPDHGPR